MKNLSIILLLTAISHCGFSQQPKKSILDRIDKGLKKVKDIKDNLEKVISPDTPNSTAIPENDNSQSQSNSQESPKSNNQKINSSVSEAEKELVAAINDNDLELVKSVCKKQSQHLQKTAFLCFASLKGNLDIVKFILSAKLSGNTSSLFISPTADSSVIYVTPFAAATGEGKIDIVKFFLENNKNNQYADIIENSYYPNLSSTPITLGNPLSAAAFYNRKEVLALLLATNFKPKYNFWHSGSPAFLALKNKSWECAELLKDNGADIYTKSDGWSFLHCFAQSGKDSQLQELIEKGLYVNIQSQKKNKQSYTIIDDVSPLMLATESGHLSTCKLLLLYGADPYQKNANNQSAIDIAKSKGLKEIEKALRNIEVAPIQKNWKILFNEAQQAYKVGEFVIANSLSNASLNKINLENQQNTADYLNVINLLADSYTEIAIFKKADYWLTKAAEWSEKKYGRISKEYIVSIIKLSNFYAKTAQYDKSRLLLKVLFDIAQNPQITGALENAKIYDAFGLHYYYYGDRIKSDQWFEKSLKIKEKVVGMESNEYAKTLLWVFNSQQKFSIKGGFNTLKVKELVDESKTGFKKALEGVFDRDHVLINSAISDDELKAMGKTRESFNKELKQDSQDGADAFMGIFNNEYKKIKITILYPLNVAIKLPLLVKTTDGEISAEYLNALKFLLYTYEQLNNQEKITKLKNEITEIEEKINKISPERGLVYFPKSETDIVKFSRTPGINQTKYITYLEEQRGIIEKTYGKVHPTYVFVLEELAKMLDGEKIGESKAYYYKYTSEAALLKNVVKTQFSTPFVDENTYIGLLPEIEIYRNQLKSFTLTWAKKTEVGVSFLTDFILNDKQRLLYAYQKFRKGEAQKTIDFVIDYNRRMDNAGVNKSDRLDPAVHAKILTDFNRIMEDIIIQGTNFMGVKADNVPYFDENKFTWQQIQKNIKRGEAVVEYFYIDKSKTHADSLGVDYYALILKPNAKVPELKYLFHQDELKAQLSITNIDKVQAINDKYRGEPQKTKGGTTPPSTKPILGQNRLYQLCWQKIEASLEKSDSVIYYSPVGLLHQVSFAAIITPDKKPLSERYTLNYFSSAQNLIVPSLELTISDSTNVALFGNPPSSEGQLAGASSEIDEIQSLLSKKKVKIQPYIGPQATEGNFKNVGLQLKSPDLIHVAAHGEYFDETKGINAMLNSVLFMAGSDRQKRTELTERETNEGLLTALEMSYLNFTNAKLVVLSACDTGLGDFGGDEGVLGFQRALKVAGAEYVLLSLWRVPDKATAEMMRYFYTNLSSGQSIKQAFGKAQKEMRVKYPLNPYYWGAFVLMR